MEALFKVGSVYRQKNGVVSEITCGDASHCYVNTLWAPNGKEMCGGGGRNLFDGRYSLWKDEGDDEYTLLPGELHQVNGEWIPLAESPDTDFHRAVDRLAGGGEAPKQDAWEAYIRQRSAPTTERTRPALTWATPKPVDRFEGYVVKMACACKGECACGGKLPAPCHPLQRMTDPADPLHGSAFLRKGA